MTAFGILFRSRRYCFFCFWDKLFWVAFLKQSLNRLQVESLKVNKSQRKSIEGKDDMPLTQKVTFTAMLQRGKRVQIPKLIRWQFKMEPNQVLKVGVNAINVWTGWQFFYAKMGKDGRILIPKLTLALLRSENPNLIGYVMEITLEPA
jgi:hypothetical protein